MKFQEADMNEITGTCLQGFVPETYQKLVEVFGEPDRIITGDKKVMVQWRIKFEDGTIATIYDYKSCDAYCNNGLQPEQNTDWHIGGFNKNASEYVLNAVIGIQKKDK